MSVHQSNISTNKAELKQAQYKDIDKRYFDQAIQLKVVIILIKWSFNLYYLFYYVSNSSVLLQTTEMANKDLDRYYNALDKYAICIIFTSSISLYTQIKFRLWILSQYVQACLL